MKRRQVIKSFFGAFLLPFLPFKNIFSNEECITTDDILGPYFLEGAPNINVIAPEINGIQRLFITGTLYAKDCITPIPNALIDVWQANNEGEYEDVNYRGKLYTDQAGNYAFESILPGKYLNGSYYRPSHIHYKVVYLNHPELVTQLYFEGDSSIDVDPWASDPSAINRIIPLSTDDSDHLHGVFDIFLNIDPNSVDIIDPLRNDLPTKIHSLYPNPAKNEFSIQFYCSQLSHVTIDMCNVSGKTVKVLLDEKLPKKLHQIKLQRPHVSSGVYVIRIAINGNLVDAKRLLIY